MHKVLLLFFLGITTTQAQIFGCTDPLSLNFNSAATINDGNCRYKPTTIKPVFSKRISDSIKESSGLIAFDSLLWTHNDDHDTTLYGLDLFGKIKKKITLANVKNNDWEEISQDDTHLYIGDFGNNSTGNRTDLKILKIDKKSFLAHQPKIDTISFSYSSQTDFSPKKANSTNFDCEAFVILNDSIYLFSKQWKNSKTSLFVLPNTAGTHIAKFKKTLDTKGLVTAATLIPNEKGIVLCGYSKIGKPFLYLLYDYKNDDFFSGNKRRIKLSLPFHQIESITTPDGLQYYLTNEAFIRKPFLNVSQQIHLFDLKPYVKKEGLFSKK